MLPLIKLSQSHRVRLAKRIIIIVTQVFPFLRQVKYSCWVWLFLFCFSFFSFLVGYFGTMNKHSGWLKSSVLIRLHESEKENIISSAFQLISTDGFLFWLRHFLLAYKGRKSFSKVQVIAKRAAKTNKWIELYMKSSFVFCCCCGVGNKKMKSYIPIKTVIRLNELLIWLNSHIVTNLYGKEHIIFPLVNDHNINT